MLWKYLKFIGCCLLLSFCMGTIFGYFGLTSSIMYGIVMSILMLVDLILIIALIPLVIIFCFIDKLNKK